MCCKDWSIFLNLPQTYGGEILGGYIHEAGPGVFKIGLYYKYKSEACTEVSSGQASKMSQLNL